MIYVVAGHARSGTSMMMRALEAGGMRVARSASRERLNVREPGGRPLNRGGLYELEPREMRKPGWPRVEHDGKVVKCLLNWLPFLAAHEYRVALVTRDAEEVRQSYNNCIGGDLRTEDVEAAYREARLSLENRKDVASVTVVNYHRTLEQPRETFARLLQAGWRVGIERAAAAVDESQWHFRRGRLVEGL